MIAFRLTPLGGVGLAVGIAVAVPAPAGMAGAGVAARTAGVVDPVDGVDRVDAGAAAPSPAELDALDVAFATDVFGISGSVRAVLALPGAEVALPLRWTTPRPGDVRYGWVPVLGTTATPGERRTHVPGAPFIAPGRAGVYELELDTDRRRLRLGDVRLVVRVPFAAKGNGRINGYDVGRYPTEGSGRMDRYAPPAGFIEVTPDNRRLRLSDHFRLSEFLTHDQQGVWPKYAVVDTRLLDKLELLLGELSANGVRAERMFVMSGFRTPQYNRRGLSLGRARLSRHQFGDAADVWVDSDADGYIDDLNGDGRRDTRDARLMLRAIDRLEARHPELLGGAGVYGDNGVHGPFIHVDVRGYRARW